MKVYMVGGAVRDIILGRIPKDIDYVVVGATHQEMIDSGFTQVGSSFPVYIHPTTGDEYALARTERKTGVGYNGFETVSDPSVTLEEDLLRRDLTINSMAMDADTGEIIDPYGGRYDLLYRRLRHTSAAFAEDPVRVLRTARFAARYGYTVVDETLTLMAKVAPELAYVPFERVYAEFEKAMGEQHPTTMFNVMFDTKVKHHLPSWVGIKAWEKAWTRMPYNKAGFTAETDPFIRMGFVVAHAYVDFSELVVPSNVMQLAHDVSTYALTTADTTSDIVDKLTSMRAFTDRQRLDNWIKAMRMTSSVTQHRTTEYIAVYEAAKVVDTAAIASQFTSGEDIKNAIRQARIAAAS